MDQGQQARADQGGVQALQALFRQHALGHACGGRGGQAVDPHAVLLALDGQGLHQADQRHLGGAVVGLAEVAVEARRRGRHHDAAVALLAHRLPHGLGADRRAHQVDVDHQAEVGQVHLGEALVAQDAGVADQDVDPAPYGLGPRDHGADGGLVGHRGGDPDRLAPGGDDLGGHAVGGLLGQVVDRHLGALAGQVQRMGAAQAAARTGYDRDASLQQHRIVSPTWRTPVRIRLF